MCRSNVPGQVAKRRPNGGDLVDGWLQKMQLFSFLIMRQRATRTAGAFSNCSLTAPITLGAAASVRGQSPGARLAGGRDGAGDVSQQVTLVRPERVEGEEEVVHRPVRAQPVAPRHVLEVPHRLRDGNRRTRL